MSLRRTSAALPPAVVLGLSPTGLHVVRELGRAGIRVVGVAGGRQAGCASRYLSDCIIAADPERRLHLLCERFPAAAGGNVRKPVLIPTSDQDVDFVIARADRLSRHFAFQSSYSDGLAAQIMTKESFYELCREHRVTYPRLWKGLPDEIAALRDRIAYPCMIKPSRIHDLKEQMGGRKGWIVRDAPDFDQVIPSIPPGAGVLLLQEIVPGAESSITLYCGYFGETGVVSQSFTARKLRQYPPGFGSASLAQSNPEDSSRAIAERLLMAVGYKGIAAAEFKRDPRSGDLKIIEVNVRPSLWFALTSSAGKLPVLAAYHDLANTGEIPKDLPQREGVRWRYLLKDLSSAAFYRLNPSFLLPCPDLNAVGARQARVSAVLAIDDAKPAVAELVNYAAKAARRVRRRLVGR